MELIFLKLGGSLITQKNKPFTERRDIIERLAKEIHEARQEKDFSLLIGNGGGSYPHTAAKEYQTANGIINQDSYRGIAEVQDAAARLNRIIIRALLDAGENAISIQPSALALAKNSRIIDFHSKELEMFLEKNMIPVVYGDVGLDTEKGCCILSTEELFVALVQKLNPTKIIMCGVVDGVMTADPTIDPTAILIKEINHKNYEDVKKSITGSSGIDVTGGMIEKVNKSLELTDHDTDVWIINGAKENRLKQILLGSDVIGTVIKA